MKKINKKKVHYSKHFFVENSSYLITLTTFIAQNNERQFKISGFKEDNEKSKVKEEILSLTLLKMAFQAMDFNDVLYNCMPVKSINNFYYFTKFCIFPFLAINDKKIEIWPKAGGIIPSFKKKFLNTDCCIFFHYINSNNFRIVIFDSNL